MARKSLLGALLSGFLGGTKTHSRSRKFYGAGTPKMRKRRK